MRKFFLQFFLLYGTLSITGCATWSTDDRINKLEGGSQNIQVLDLRMTHLEERISTVESTMGGLRDTAPAGKKILPRPPVEKTRPIRTKSQAAAAASPQVLSSLSIPPGGSVSVEPGETNPLKTTGAQPSHSPLLPASASIPASPLTANTEAGPGLAPLKLDVSSSAPAETVGTPNPAPPASTVAPGSVKVQADAAPEKNASRQTGKNAYDSALALYNKGQYEKAKDGFAAFLRDSPNSPLAPNALYWQGECEYARGRYDAAIMLFKDVSGKYPKHAKAAAALLKTGYSFERLKDMENARFYWQILLDDFPDSSPASLARKRMAAAG